MMKYELTGIDRKSRFENSIFTLGDCCFPCASGRLVTAWHSETLESIEK